MAGVEKRTVLATASVICGIVALFISPLAGFMLGLLAVVLGALGLLRAASSRRSGGIAAVLGMGLGVVAIVVKIIHGALSAIF